MPTTPVIAQGKVSRRKPQRNRDNVADGVPFRVGAFGEEYNLSLVNKAHLLAEEGSYFVYSNPTPGTGIANQAAPTGVPSIGGNADASPYMVICNNSSSDDDGPILVNLDYLRFRVTGAGTNGTAINFLIQVDSMASRIPAGNTNLGGTAITPVNPNGFSNAKPVTSVFAGALTVNKSTANGRQMPNIQFRGVIPVVNDIYIVSFGPAEYGVGSLISSGTAVCQQSFGHPPVLVGPQQCALVYLWLPSQSVAGSFEFDGGVWER